MFSRHCYTAWAIMIRLGAMGPCTRLRLPARADLSFNGSRLRFDVVSSVAFLVSY